LKNYKEVRMQRIRGEIPFSYLLKLALQGKSVAASLADTHKKDGAAGEAAADTLLRPEDMALIREFRELVRKYGYRAKEVVMKVNAPVQLEGGGTMELFSMSLEIYRWGEGERE
jgi:hypothetical protein